MAAPPPPVPETLEELNARIDLVELRVVRRDMEFRQHALSLKSRGRTVLTLSHWLRPVLGMGSGWLFWRLFRKRPHHRHASRGEDRPSGRAGRGARPPRGAGLFSGLLATLLGEVAGAHASQEPGGHGAHGPADPSGHPAHSGHPGHGGPHGPAAKPELALLQMLTMAWGFMPVRIRGSLGPQSTQLLLGVVAGLMHGMQRKKAARKEQRPEADQHAQAAEAQAQARQAGASVRGGSAAAPAAPKAVPPVSPTSS